MSSTSSARTFRPRRLLLAAAVVAAAAATVAAAVPAMAGGTHHAATNHRTSTQAASSRVRPNVEPTGPLTAGSDYLALGDSVSFGYREPYNLPTPTYVDASSFVGFPENIAAELGVHVANASCPGETSSSLIDSTAPSNGCETAAGGTGPGYRTVFPLHVSYSGSQLAYGVHYLRTHRTTRLVTLMIGANDGFLCQSTTADHCASELPSVLAKITKNVATILQAVRNQGHYRGQIVIVNYYSLDYTSATQNATTLGLNRAMDSGARRFGVRIADGYGAFERAAAQAGGDTCKAGLLTTLTTGGCGVHPSVAGQEALAGAVERAVRH